MRRGFTLVELLVVIGIIAVLIAILVPTLAKARDSAGKVSASSDMRQLTTAYIQYTIDNKGALPFGYPTDKVNGVPIQVELTNGTIIGSIYAKRYPWRLIRYLDNVWQIVFYNISVPEDDYVKSVSPSIGLNSVFLGGHDSPYFQGYLPTGQPSDGKPNVGKHVMFRTSEIKSPAQQIVFIETFANSTVMGGTGDYTGAYYVQPPRGKAPNGIKRWWTASEDGQKAVSRTSVYGGLPNGRFRNGTLVAFFDGHIASLTPRELEDMRLWTTRATSADYDF